MSFFEYHLLNFLFPHSRDFLDMGFGISARHKRCRKYWDRHISFSKSFQRNAFDGGKTLPSTAVLGSGRLYDVPLSDLLKTFSRVSLYDADPSAILHSGIKNLSPLVRKKLSVHCRDVTSCLQPWSQALHVFLKENQQEKRIELLSAFLLTLKAGDSSAVPEYDTLISLNLLGQIPLYWRDRFFKSIEIIWGLELNEESCSEELGKALHKTMRLLQNAHLRLLAEKAINSIILISDTHFYYYQKDKSAWLVEDALKTYPVETLNADFSLQASDSWLWHIAPQDVEQEEYGVIHRIEAWSFSRKG